MESLSRADNMVVIVLYVVVEVDAGFRLGPVTGE